MFFFFFLIENDIVYNLITNTKYIRYIYHRYENINLISKDRGWNRKFKYKIVLLN